MAQREATQAERAPFEWQGGGGVSKLYDLVPKSQRSESRWVWQAEVPRRHTSPLWYLRWPQPVIDLVRGDRNPRWFCLPEHVEEATEFRPRRIYAAYCSAPPGIRCRCGAQLHGHDPGDEG